MQRIYNTTEFVKRVSLIKDNCKKYDYSNVKYIKSTQKVTIKCNICRKYFNQTPQNHLKGNGCPNCNHAKKYTLDEFIKKALLIKNNIIHYNYDKVLYINVGVKVMIHCYKCSSDFMQTPRHHLTGRGCQNCYGTKKGNTNSFIKKSTKIHKNKFDYSKSVYVNRKTKILIKCKICKNEFLQMAANHLKGFGCSVCSNKIKSNTENFIEKSIKIHGDIYDYSKVDYKGALIKTLIICKKCRCNFLQQPSKHLNNHGCPVCKSSYGEKAIVKLLNSMKTNYIRQKMFDDCRNINPLPFDFYLPKYNISIEFDGIQHSKICFYTKNKESLIKRKKLDKIKTDYCILKNIKLLRISYKQINDIEKIIKREIYEIEKNRMAF